MIPVPPGVRVLLATRPVDFRKGAHGLAALAAEALGQEPFSGAVIVFRAKRADRVKILLWDGSGLVLVWKRLQQGAFRWPPVMDGVMKLSAVEVAALRALVLATKAERDAAVAERDAAAAERGKRRPDPT